MKKYFIILICIIFIVGFYFYYNKQNIYQKNIFVMDTYINIKIYSNKNANPVLEETKKIYEEYHKLTDKHNSYDNIKNIYYINNALEEKIIIDEKLADILNYSINWHQESNYLFDINMGLVIDVWKKFIALNRELPTYDELQALKNKQNNLIINGNVIKNNNLNLDLGAIAKGYATNIVGKYLKEKGFNKFIINAGGHVLVGDKYNRDSYKIGIKDPSDTGETFIIVYVDNMAVSTSGSYERFAEVDGELYHHIINPKTLFPSNYMKSVSVITSDSALADILTTVLFLMPIEEGQEFLKNYNAEAIWYGNNGEIVKSEGFSNYE